MSKLNEVELLKELVGMKKHTKGWAVLNPQKIEMAWSKKREQAYQQIKEMIQSDVWRKLELLLERNERLKAQIADYKYALSKIPEKPEVTEEFIEEKAIKMSNIVISFNTLGSGTNWMANPLERCKDFIRSLVEEIK